MKILLFETNFKELRKNILFILSSILLGLLFWYFLEMLIDKRHIVPKISTTVNYLIKNHALILKSLWETMKESLLGISLAFIIGIFIACLSQYIKTFGKLFMPFGVMIQATPIIAFANIANNILGEMYQFNHHNTKFFILNTFFACLISIYPIILNTYIGLDKVPTDKLNWMKVIGANSKQIFWHLRIPNAIPKCFDGLQTAVPLSIVGAIVSEMVVTSTVGLGHIFEMGARNVSPEMTFASLCILITFSTLLFGIFYLISLYVKRIIYGKTNS